MPKGSNNMANKSDEQFIIMQDTIESKNKYMKSNKQYSHDKMINPTEDFKAMIA